MRIASWNVNSIRARHDLFLEWIKRDAPDVVCLQETKVVDDDFPTDELVRLGYAVAMAGQKTYNGVAIVSRLPMRDVKVGLADDAADADRRLIAATIRGVRVLSAYIPNGKSLTSPSFNEKLRWLGRLRETLERTTRPVDPIALCGDFNVAREDRDVWAPERMRGELHFHPAEHAALDHLLAYGLSDAFRLHHAEAGHFSWWDFRTLGFQKGQGLRIDYVFLSAPLVPRCTAAMIDVQTRAATKPSDHAAVIVDLAD